MKYYIKNVSGSQQTIAGEVVANEGLLEFADDTAVKDNLVAAVFADVPNITSLFEEAEIEYWVDDTEETEAEFWQELSKMEVLASTPVNKWVALKHSDQIFDTLGKILTNGVVARPTNDELGNSVLEVDELGNLALSDHLNPTAVTLTELAAGGAGGITESSHGLLDQLVHEISENNYLEYTRVGLLITNATYWTSEAKTLKIREYQYTYANNLITGAVEIQYNAAGVAVETLTYVYNYDGSTLSNVGVTRS